MKKILLCILAMALFGMSVRATEVNAISKEGKIQEQLNSVGFRILNSNAIDKRIVFIYKPDAKNINAGAMVGMGYPRNIYVYKGLMRFIESDDELAAILSHEISHSLDSYDGIFRGSCSSWSMALSPRKYEYKSDKRGVDYMVNAGYNPLAMIVILNKMSGQYRYDTLFSTHPLTSRRLAVIYEYIYKKYPSFLANNEYKNNIYYQNFLLTSQQNREKFQEKVKNNNGQRVNYL